MVKRQGVNLIPYELTPLQAALIEWLKANPYSRLEIVVQDGVPIQALVATEDGVGKKSVLFSDVAKKLKLPGGLRIEKGRGDETK